MATRQLYATGTFKYQNRMMQAGDPVEMTDPHRRLYLALGKVTDEKPRTVRAMTAKAVEEAPRAKPRKRTRKAKK
jgi:hypothetical protein